MNTAKTDKERDTVPPIAELIGITFKALKELGGSGTNDEIFNKVVEIENFSDNVLNKTRKGKSEIAYHIAWARTALRVNGIIENVGRSVWAISGAFKDKAEVDGKAIYGFLNASRKKSEDALSTTAEDIEKELDKPWREELLAKLKEVAPTAFEELTLQMLRRCGLDNLSLTKKSGDGGIDGLGQIKLNSIISMNVAFQCKRYKDTVSSPAIRDFRGSLTSNQMGLFVTTGNYTKEAREEAQLPGKTAIELIDGEKLVEKLEELELGLRKTKDGKYEIDPNFGWKVS